MRARPFLLGVIFICLWGDQSRADDWVMARHDAARTGASSGRTNLPLPAVRWRHYLGGGLGTDQLTVTDVDHDGVTDVVYIAGTRVSCKHSDGVLVWESELIGATSLAGVADLDGDNHLEVVVSGTLGGVFVLAGDTGRVLWELPVADRARGAAARVVDVDGDHALDVYIGQCTSAPAAGYAYNFRAGFGAARRLWALSRTGQCGTGFDAIGDFDGDGVPEVVPYFARSALDVYSGRTGQSVATAPAPASGDFAGGSMGLFANVDDDPAQELFVVTNHWQSNPAGDIGARRVAMFDWQPGAMAGPRLRWESSWPRPENGNVAFNFDSVRDLDGDHRPEVTLSFYDSSTRRWTLRVHDARTGQVLATRENTEYVGTATVGGDLPTVLAIDDDLRTVALRLSGGQLHEAWRIERQRPATLRDLSVAATDGLNTRVLAMQFDDDPALELVMVPFDPAIEPDARQVTSLVAVDVDTMTPRTLGTFTAPDQTTVLVTQRGVGLSRPYEQTVAVTSDGYLLSLDRELVSTNRLINGEFVIPGMRVGGYYSGPGLYGHTPSIAMLPTGQSTNARAVVVRDSRPSLIRLDVTRASLSSPPRVLWSRSNAAWPVLVDADGDQKTDIAAVEGRDLSLIDAIDGTHTRWTAHEAFGPLGSRVRSDLVPLRRAGATGYDLVAWASDLSNSYRAFVFTGLGQSRWSGFSRTPHSGFTSFAVGDLTGDGTDDIVTAMNTSFVLNGADGTLAHEGSNTPYAAPVILRPPSAATEIYLHAIYGPDRVLGADLSVIAARGDNRPTYVMGAPVQCDGRELYAVAPDSPIPVPGTPPQPPKPRVEVQLTAPGALATNAGVIHHTVLVGGRAYPSVEAVPASVRPGTLGNLTRVADLEGMGRPGFLVGSTDGWLYALDACSLELRWSQDFHYPVGEPVVGDTDGDGVDDVLVTVADGYLYGLDRRAHDASTEVRDAPRPEGNAPIADSDVDEIETFNTLWSSWAPVAGASRYQVRVTTQSGTALQFPEYSEVMGTSARISELPLRFGNRYRIGVVAVSADGSSAEAFSDGVTIVDRSPPTISLEATHTTFAPRAGESTDLTVVITDLTGLASSRVELHDSAGQTLLTVDDNTHPTSVLPDRTVRFTWTGTDAMMNQFVAPGVYVLTATATDVGGHVTSSELRITVDGRVRTMTGPGTSPDSDNGCGCRVGSTPRNPRTNWVFVTLFAAFAAAIESRRLTARRNSLTERR